MRRIFCAVFIMLTTSALTASDAIFRLSGWAEIPSTYRHPGPVSGQFTTPTTASRRRTRANRFQVSQE